MDIIRQLANTDSNYLESILDRSTLLNLTKIGDIYRRYIELKQQPQYSDFVISSLNSLIDELKYISAMVINEDLPVAYLGDYIVRESARNGLMNTLNNRSEVLKLSQESITFTYSTNDSTAKANINSKVAQLKTNAANFTKVIAKRSPKTVCLYQQFNICCYTQEYVDKYSLEKLAYKNIENINEEVAKIFNFVFGTSHTAADKLGEYYLRINDSLPRIFLDHENGLGAISAILNYSYRMALEFLPYLAVLSDWISASGSTYTFVPTNTVLDDSTWRELGEKYQRFFEYLKMSTLNY